MHLALARPDQLRQRTRGLCKDLGWPRPLEGMIGRDRQHQRVLTVRAEHRDLMKAMRQPAMGRYLSIRTIAASGDERAAE